MQIADSRVHLLCCHKEFLRWKLIFTTPREWNNVLWKLGKDGDVLRLEFIADVKDYLWRLIHYLLVIKDTLGETITCFHRLPNSRISPSVPNFFFGDK